MQLLREMPYETLHPEMRHGAIGNGREKSGSSCHSTFADDTAAKGRPATCATSSLDIAQQAPDTLPRAAPALPATPPGFPR